MNYLEKYIEHCSGLYSLFSWMESNDKNGNPYYITNQTIYLNPTLSRFFSFGVGKNKSNKSEAFFACMPIETEWFSLIKWEKIILKENDLYIYFVSQNVQGDEETLSDIPSFILGVYVDTKEKKDLIAMNSKLIGREIHLNSNKDISVNFHRKIFDIPIENVKEDYYFNNESSLFDYSKILSKKEKESEQFSEKPSFIGDIAKIEGTSDLLKKWKDNIL